MLVAGLLMSSAGAGMALSGGGNASVAQYSAGGKEGGIGILGDINTKSVPVAQTTRQLSTPSNGELPFTGFLTFTVLAAGLILLATGLLMRWKTRLRATE